MNNEEKILSNLYRDFKSSDPIGITLLPSSGSYRRYYRISTGSKPVIGVFNEDLKENEAFFSFTDHFMKLGIPVPELLGISDARTAYLLEDLGDITLYGFLSGVRSKENVFPSEVLPFYRKVIQWLPRFQVEAGRGLDYSRCYPRSAFDRQSMMWDLNYFKYYFLKLAKVSFDEQKLEDDFNVLTGWLLSAGCESFMYRDFQSRNIMLCGTEPWFIDYQGGRKGPLHYDIASLLYDAKAAIPADVRKDLLAFYIRELKKYLEVDDDEFIRYYYGFVLIRILQAMGAYGFRGYYENKPHFLQSIPYAIKNLEYLIQHKFFPEGVPMLRSVLETIIGNRELRSYHEPEQSLVVSIYSFSYKNGIPKDKKGHGGGFAFDCRALPNPGRMAEYRQFTGNDRPVIEYLSGAEEVREFLDHVYALVDKSVRTYLERNFTTLTVAFGCTGGMHRSVYCAESLAKHLISAFPVKVEIIHTESSNFPART